jgi:hypothetical protein
LSQEGRVEVDAASRGLVMREQEGMSGVLGRSRLVGGLSRKLAQAYPQMPLVKFLGICDL